MKALGLALVILLAAAALAGTSSPLAVAAPGSSKISAELADMLAEKSSARVIVSLSADAPPDGASPADLKLRSAQIAATQHAATRNISVTDFRVQRRFRSVPALAGTASAAGVRALAARREVVHVALDAKVQASLGEAVPLIRADDVHELGVTGASVIVAVLDTGIDSDHPQLVDDLHYQKCFLASGTCLGGGTIGPSAEDGDGHGTHVSGIITAAGPPTGVAPDALIDAFKVLDDSGSGDLSDVLSAYDDIITSHPDVDIINMSLGSFLGFRRDTCDGLVPALTTAVATARSMGIVSFASSGNSGQKARIAYPACLSDVVSVGAAYDGNLGPQSWLACQDSSTAMDQVACFSQSDISLDLLAPGASIDSTWPGGGQATRSGTSMAAPVAAAVAALLRQNEPFLSPAQVEARMQETGVAVVDAANGVSTCRVDAYEAVVNDGGSSCVSTPPPAPANDHFVSASGVVPPLPYEDSQITFGATDEDQEPHACGNLGASLWYRFTPGSDVLVLASTEGSNFQTAVAVYMGASIESLTQVACDDGSDQLPSHALFQAQAGVSYYVQVGGSTGDTGNLAFRLAEAKPLTCGQRSSPALCMTAKNAAGQQGLLGCDSSSEPTECTAAIGVPFALTLESAGLPAAGYIGFQTEAYLGGLASKPRASCGAEVVWPDRGSCASNSGPAGQVLHAAISSGGLPSTYQGGVVQIDVTCPTAGTFDVALAAWPSSIDGAAYYGPTFETISVEVEGQRAFDTDGDTTTDAVLDVADGVSIVCVDADTDEDGCPNTNELQTAIGSENSGGRRSPLNRYDYFNPTHDGLNRVDDVLKVADRFFYDDNDANPGLPPYTTGYDPDTDRTDDPAYGPEQPWRLLGPNGLQRVDDILHQVKQFFHDCA
jgi:hypothetical protein